MKRKEDGEIHKVKDDEGKKDVGRIQDFENVTNIVTLHLWKILMRSLIVRNIRVTKLMHNHHGYTRF